MLHAWLWRVSVWQPLHHSQTLFQCFFKHEKIFLTNECESTFLLFVVEYVYNLDFKGVDCSLWSTKESRKYDFCHLSNAFVRGHKNMSHICKWRKIVLIIKGLEDISVGRHENTQKLCDDVEKEILICIIFRYKSLIIFFIQNDYMNQALKYNCDIFIWVSCIL